MGTFSKYHRYRDAGNDVNVNNVANFGQPARSLFTTTKIFTLHHHIDITDEKEQIAYQANSKVISIHDRTTVTDAAGAEVCMIDRKIVSLRQTHLIKMADGTEFALSTELLHLIKEVQNVPELGWKVRGNILELNFELYDSNDNIIAVVGQKMISMHDKYCIDIYQPEQEDKCVAILVALQHMIADRRRQSNSNT